MSAGARGGIGWFGRQRSTPTVLRGGGGVLTLSMRRLNDLVAFCAPYEFEDVIADTTGADRVEPVMRMEWARRMYRLALKGTGSRKLASALTPNLHVAHLDREYDLFFPIFNHPHELFALATVPDWRRRSRRAACFVSELWADLLPGYLLEMLADFDHIFIGVRHAVPEVARVTGRPCTYLPLAANVLTFAPEVTAQARWIDVCNIGRRSTVTHAALLQLARQRRLTYYYDTVVASGADLRQRTFHVSNASEHRLLLATLLQGTRYYVTNRSRVNEPELTKGRDEISSRFYEGAASGTVMIGEAPRTEEFSRQFDWEDAVFHLPFDASDVGRFLEGLDADPARLARARARNIRNAALRHDWVHRFGTVLETVGMAPTASMKVRMRSLEAIAELEPRLSEEGSRVRPPLV